MTFNVSPVHAVMLFIHDLFGLPLARFLFVGPTPFVTFWGTQSQMKTTKIVK